VLDATWADPAWRKAALSMANETSAELVEFRCVAPIEVALDRARHHTATDPSDADEEVVRAAWVRQGPWPTAVDLDTSRDPAEVVASALTRILGPTGAARAGAEED
jgi:predicted kinase